MKDKENIREGLSMDQGVRIVVQDRQRDTQKLRERPRQRLRGDWENYEEEV